MFRVPDGIQPRQFVNLALGGYPLPEEWKAHEAAVRAAAEAVDDKWGPAGCVQNSPGEFIFFGWAPD